MKIQIKKEVEKLMNCSDEELLTLSLNSNSDWKDNYQMTMSIRLKRALQSLKKSISISSWVMGIMTLIILVLTFVLVWIGIK